MFLAKILGRYPDGTAGVGLLLVRMALGVPVALQGFSQLPELSNASTLNRIGAISALVSGLALVIGILTPLFACVIAAAGTAVLLKYAQYPPPQLFEPSASLFALIVIALGLALIGPGALSIDARLFGRREVIITRR